MLTLPKHGAKLRDAIGLQPWPIGHPTASFTRPSDLLMRLKAILPLANQSQQSTRAGNKGSCRFF
jgi:hypothetical protein